jgi:hypothetical protein
MLIINSVEVELESAVGPRVIVTGKMDEAAIEAELPEGWTVGDNWNHAYPVDTQRRVSYSRIRRLSHGKTLSW